MKRLLLIGLLVLAGCTPEKRMKDPNNNISPFGKANYTTKDRSPNT